MYQLTKRQESILYYILVSKENVNTKKLAANYQLSERSIHYDLEYISAWLNERGASLSKNRPNGIFFEGTDACREQVLRDIFQQDIHSVMLDKTDRVEYVFHKLLLADRIVTSEEIGKELMVSKPTVLNAIKEAEQKLSELHLKLESKKGAGYWVEGKETILRLQIVQVIARILMRNKIRNYDSLYAELQKDKQEVPADYAMVRAYCQEIDVFPIYDLLNIMRKENGILISDVDSFELFISIVVMVRRLLNEHSVKRDDISKVERNEETRRYVLARAICEQLEDDYDVICNKSEIIYTLLRLISYNVTFVKKEAGYQKEELSATIDLMLQVLKDFEIVHVDNRHMQDLKDDLYEYLNLLMRKKKLQIGTPNPLLVQTKAGYPHIFKEAIRMAEIFKMREGVELTEEEIGTIAIYIAAYADTPAETGIKSALIVCNEGKGLSKVLYNRVKNNIPGLEIKKIVSVNEMNQNDELLQGIDLIISTTELGNVSVPVFCVSPIISVFDIRYISDYLNGHSVIKAPDKVRGHEGYLESAIMSILSKYLDMSHLDQVNKDLEYILTASMGYVSEENVRMIQEEYAYKVSMVVVKLADMFLSIKGETGKDIEVDTMMGLVIHILMSVSRWEKKEFFQEKGNFPETKETAAISRAVEEFLNEVAEIFHYPIGRGEAVAITRYLV